MPKPNTVTNKNL